MENNLDKYSVGSNNIIKNITKEVIRECGKIDVTVEENVVSLAVKLLSLDPSYGLRLDAYYDRHSLEEFVQKCVEKFRDHLNSSVKTLNMQIYYLDHLIDTDRIVTYQNKQIKKKIETLTNEILLSDVKTKEDRDKLFKKIVIDIIVNNSLGSPTNGKVVKETANALKSVMSKNDIAAFGGLKRFDRFESLLNLREIVCGIHIFNKDSGMGGEGIVDIEPLVLSGHTTTKAQLSISLSEIQNRINLLATALNNCICENHDAKQYYIEIPFDYFTEEEFDQLKDVLIMHRQHEYYVNTLIRSLARTKADIDHLLKAFKEKLRNIHEIVQFRTAIPTDKIFPRFAELAQCWLRLQYQIYVLSEINMVNERLMQLTDEVHPWEDAAFNLLGENMVETDEDRAQNEINGKIIPIDDAIKVFEYSSKLKLQYLGFCTWTLVNGHGLLLPANLAIGICCYKEKYYAFRSKETASLFQKQPEKYIFSVIEIGRAHPELIVFLDIFDDVKSFRDDYHRVECSIQPRLSISIDTQTETHPIPCNIDKEYTWNVWDLRRKAIQLADIRKCKTSSTQTNVQYQRFGINTQTWSPRDSSCHTKHDGATNVPKPQTYVRNIRGSDNAINSQQVNLTRYVEDENGAQCIDYNKPVKKTS